MPAAKLCSGGTFDAMKSEEGNDSLDTFIRQAIGKEPLIPFTRTTDNPVQWIQLLDVLDQPDLPGWPMMTPVKVRMQKCEKCSQEFCSPVNYRRHIRVHRRSFNVNKECNSNRDLLAAFWDKISLEQAKEVLSFNEVMIKKVSGSMLIRDLASSVRKPGIWTLPPVYVRAGNDLLDIIQAKPSRLPISSQELFSILNDASERTFLCAGTAESVQKYVFDGETAKNCLELKNLVACTSFFFELQLVKAWIADKDAEALRCQKLLVEEEEAEQKRQALLLEKKKKKKLRQKEQKAKEQFPGCSRNTDTDVNVDAVGRQNSVEASGPSSPSVSNSNVADMPTILDSCLESMQPETKKSNEEDIDAHFDTRCEHIKEGDDSQTTKLQTVDPNGNRHLATNHWQAPKSRRGNRFGSNFQPSKFEPVHKLYPSKGRSLQNGTKIWTKKLKNDTDGKNLTQLSPQGETSQPMEEKNCEVETDGENLKPLSSQGETSHPIEENNCEVDTDGENVEPLPSQGKTSHPIEENNCEVDTDGEELKPLSSQGETSHPIEENNCEVDTGRENLKPLSSQGETSHPIEENNCEVIIGSISVTLKSSVAQTEESRLDEVSDISSNEHAVLLKKNASENVTKANHIQPDNNHVGSEHWRPMRHGETISVLPLDRGYEGTEGGTMLKMVPERILFSDEQSKYIDDNFDNRKKQNHEHSNDDAQQGYLPFSSVAAKEFLARRWKEAISGDHVMLVLSEPKPPGSSDVQLESSTNISDPPKNQNDRNIQLKISKNLEKGVKIKRIPKQEAVG